MDRLLITADDFTGSLDTGIQFAKRGVPVKVVTDWEYDFANASEYPVVVVDTESRPLTAEEAYQRVYAVTKRAKEAGIAYFYKKTDSALRGNIGSELAGMMEASGERHLMMVPAFPKVKRFTKEGIHYIDGVPVADSVFGKDPFEPVRYSRVEDIIHSQWKASVENIPEHARGCVKLGEEGKVYLFDVTSEESLEELAELLKENKTYRLCSGCAGFASYYHKLLDFPTGKGAEIPSYDKILCLCGSVNPITVAQVAYGKAHGFSVETISNEKKLDPFYYKTEEGQRELDFLYEKIGQSGKFIVNTWDIPGEETVESYAASRGLSKGDIRRRLTDTLGEVACEMLRRGFDGVFSFTGGDTLMGFMRQSGCKELVPVAEIGQGAVLCKACLEDREIAVISKSGGFGGEDIFVEMIKK